MVVAVTKVVGSKFKPGRGVAAVAKLVRADIAAAFADGTLPKGLSVEVSTNNAAMGAGSLTVLVTAVPFLCFGEVYAMRPRGAVNPGYTPEAAAVMGKLRVIVEAYGYLRGDGRTAVVNFYRDVILAATLANEHGAYAIRLYRWTPERRIAWEAEWGTDLLFSVPRRGRARLVEEGAPTRATRS